MFASAATPTSRRRFLATAGGMSLVGLVGMAFGLGSIPSRAAAATRLKMYRSAGCGCCLKWAAAAKTAGFEIDVVNVDDLMAVKKRLGVPASAMSCHTTVAGPYVIEGHVPFDAVRKLLAGRPPIAGIAVPGMPAGSPGMEMADGSRDPFDVLAFDRQGRTRVFS